VALAADLEAGEYDSWPERCPSGTQPIESKPEPVSAVTWRQFVAVPVPPPTRGIELRIGVTTGKRFFAGACRSKATRPVPVEIDLAIRSSGVRSAPLTRSSVSWVGFIGVSFRSGIKKPGTSAGFGLGVKAAGAIASRTRGIG